MDAFVAVGDRKCSGSGKRRVSCLVAELLASEERALTVTSVTSER